MVSLDDYPPLTDDEVRALGYEPTEKGWVPINSEPQIGRAEHRPEAVEVAGNPEELKPPEPAASTYRATVRVGRTPRPRRETRDRSEP